MPDDAGYTLYYVRTDSLGTDPEIGTRLAQAFWNSFHERMGGVATFALANRGIFLALDDSPVLEGLRRLSDRGCPIYVCGTCMDFYGVRDRLAVGEPGSIPLLQQLMCAATKVVTF
jgi:hypothetical protein